MKYERKINNNYCKIFITVYILLSHLQFLSFQRHYAMK